MGSSASSRTEGSEETHHRAGHRPRPQHHGAGARHRRGPEPTGTSRPEHGAAAQVPRPEPLKRHQGQRIDRPFGQVEHRPRGAGPRHERQHPAVEPRADHGRSLRGPPLARPAHRDQHPRAVRRDRFELDRYARTVRGREAIQDGARRAIREPGPQLAGRPPDVPLRNIWMFPYGTSQGNRKTGTFPLSPPASGGAQTDPTRPAATRQARESPAAASAAGSCSGVSADCQHAPIAAERDNHDAEPKSLQRRATGPAPRLADGRAQQRRPRRDHGEIVRSHALALGTRKGGERSQEPAGRHHGGSRRGTTRRTTIRDRRRTRGSALVGRGLARRLPQRTKSRSRDRNSALDRTSGPLRRFQGPGSLGYAPARVRF